MQNLCAVSPGKEKGVNFQNIFAAYKITDIIQNNKEKNEKIKFVRNYCENNNGTSNSINCSTNRSIQYSNANSNQKIFGKCSNNKNNINNLNSNNKIINQSNPSGDLVLKHLLKMKNTNFFH